MYGLVRQSGPWPLTQNDILNIFRPAQYDPSDRQFIKPDAVPNGINAQTQYSQIGGGQTLTRYGIIDRPEDDPRVQTPGRRLSVNRIMGAKRLPMEATEGTALKALRAAGVAASQGTIKEVAPETSKDEPYTMPDTTPAAPLTEEKKQTLIADYEKIKALQQTGFGPFYDPSKMIEVWKQMTEDEKTIAKSALKTWKSMTVDQMVREWDKPNSIIRRIYTLYKGDMPAKYVSEVLEVVMYFLPMAGI